MADPAIPVGFDYSRALLEIRKQRTYAQIAEFCGYESAQAIGRVIKGAVPGHKHGEAIFVLYRELFGAKPPMNGDQATGVTTARSMGRLGTS